MNIMKTVVRTWWERLFSWPWHPTIKTKQVRDLKAEFARPPHATHRAYAGHVPPRAMPAPSGQVPPFRNPTRPPPAPDDASMLSVLPVLPVLTDTPFIATPPTEPPAFQSEGGGRFAGGGAYDSWEAPAAAPSPDGGSTSDSGSSGDSGTSSSSGD